MLTFLLTFVHVVVCFFLIAVILLQTGKRADLAGAFGGGGSQTAFGARGVATFLSRATTWCTVIFMCTSMLLALMHSRTSRSGSVLDSGPTPAEGLPGAPAGSGAPATPPLPAETPGQAPVQGQAPPAQQSPAPQGGEQSSDNAPAPAGSTAPAETPGQAPAPAGK